jgi:ribosomal-protein-alanine N-acetyltransferase
MHGDFIFLNEICVLAQCVNGSLSPMETSQLPPSLASERLRLEPITDADLDAVFRIYSEEQVIRYFGQDRMTDMDQARFWLEVQYRMQNMGLGMAWTMRQKDSDQVIGTVCFDGINVHWHNVGISYGLHPDYWNQGLMTEALQTLCAFAFGGGLCCPIHRIQALVFSENQPSVRVLQKLGFINEGRRLGLLYWRERYCDLDSYCLLNT